MCFFTGKKEIRRFRAKKSDDLFAYKAMSTGTDWSAFPRTRHLGSPFAGTLWHNNRHIVPHFKGKHGGNPTSGIYCVKVRKEATRQSGSYLVKIRLYGKIVEFDNGYLAEKAEVVEIYARQYTSNQELLHLSKLVKLPVFRGNRPISIKK